jgi:hypothetical protein
MKRSVIYYKAYNNKAAQIILRTKINIPISALLLELGWKPINAFLDRQRISYFSRFSELNSTRQCKQTLILPY